MTVAVVLATVAVRAWPEAEAALVFEREAVGRGEVWRCWSAQFVHFGASHWGWNLAVFAPAGLWLESLDAGRARWLLALAPAVIAATLLAGAPDLARYGGLSGVAAGVVTLLALTRLRDDRADRWLWRGVLGLVALKIALEFALDRPLVARFAGDGIRAVPLAHLAGAACALAIASIKRPAPKPKIA